MCIIVLNYSVLLNLSSVVSSQLESVSPCGDAEDAVCGQDCYKYSEILYAKLLQSGHGWRQKKLLWRLFMCTSNGFIISHPGWSSFQWKLKGHKQSHTGILESSTTTNSSSAPSTSTLRKLNTQKMHVMLMFTAVPLQW